MASAKGPCKRAYYGWPSRYGDCFYLYEFETGDDGIKCMNEYVYLDVFLSFFHNNMRSPYVLLCYAIDKN